VSHNLMASTTLQPRVIASTQIAAASTETTVYTSPASRTDTASAALGATTITDASIATTDFGRVVKPGGGIPTGAYVGAVTAGTSFVLADINGNALATTGAVTTITLANTSTKIATALLCNTSTGVVSVSVSIVQVGGTGGTTNRVISGYSLGAGDTLPLNGYINDSLLGPGDFISVNVSVATSVNFVATGAVGS
jgi:hypothetical protein